MSDKLFNNEGRPIQIAVAELVKISASKTIAALGDYAANDVISESAAAGTSWAFNGAARADGMGGTIRRARLIFSKATGMGLTLLARCRLKLYNATPNCNLNDNAANTGVLHVDKDNYVGSFDFPNLSGDGGTPEASLVPGQSNLPLDFKCAAADTALYGVLSFLDAEANETASMICSIDLIVEPE